MTGSFDPAAAIAQARLFTGVTGVPCVVLDSRGGIHHPDPADYPCALCLRVAGTDAADGDGRDGSPGDRPTTIAVPHGVRHLKWVDEAVRFGGQSIFLCENAFMHWTAPLLREGNLVGALVAGPVVTVDDPPSPGSDLRTLYDRAFRIEPARVTVLADLLTQLAKAASTGADALRLSEDTLAQQSRINELVQELKVERSRVGADPDAPTYPVDKELELLDHIRAGRVRDAQATLNELLSHVFFAAGSEMTQIRMRSRELIVLLSRAVVGAGADPQEVFGLNYQFAAAIDHQTDINGVAHWMARIVRRFADFVLYTPHLAHARSLREVTRYVRERLDQKVTVADAARVAGMSEGHFSRVFKSEMGLSFVNYMTRIRCDYAASLLRTTDLSLSEVATTCGFVDHSYFTRVFKKTTGETPGAFRRS